MADFSDIIDDFETVANAFTSVNFFLYNRVSEVNGRPENKAYPMILIKSSPNTSRGVINNSGLPRNKSYTFNIFCYNTYDRADKSTKTLQEAQAEVDLWLDQYLAEMTIRNQSGVNGFSITGIEGINGFLAHDVHNDSLIQSTYTVTVELDSACVEGTFNY